jgi:hypothetical protein
VAAVFVTTLAAVFFAGCGSGDKPPPPPAPKVETKAPPTPPPSPAPVAKVELKAPPAQVVLPILQLMPQTGMMAVALPPLTGINDKIIALARRLAPPDMNIDEQINAQVQIMAKDAGVPDAKSIADIFKGKGFDPDAPTGVFADFAPTAASAGKAIEVIKAGIEKDKAPEPAAPEGTAAKPAAPAPGAPIVPTPEQMEQAWKELQIPSMLAVAGVSDAAKAEATIKDIVAQPGSGIDASKVEELKKGDATFRSFDGGKLIYGIVGKQIFASNSMTLIDDALARMASGGAPTRYGTPECPASAPDEAVMIMRTDKIMPMVADLAPMLMSLNPQMAPFVNMQNLKELAQAYAGEDPIIATLAWTEKRIELLSRVDMAKHPAMAALTGEVKPLRLADLLPESTLLAFSQRFNKEMKENIKKNWLTALPPEVLKQQAVLQQVNQVLDMIGDEITLGIVGSDALPLMYVMVGLANPEQTKAMIQLLAPMTPVGEGEGEGEGEAPGAIQQLALPLPIPIFIAFPGDTLMLSNDKDKLKSAIGMFDKKESGGLLKSLVPPIDPATPISTLLSVKSDLITKVVLPLSSLTGGGIPPQFQDPINKVTSALKEVRMVNFMQGTWMEGSLALYFAEPAAAK